MKTVLKLEEFGFFLLSIYLFSLLSSPWWLFPLLLLAPDFGAIGYLAGPRVGATTYNLTHHKGLAAILYILGAFLDLPVFQLVGIIMLAHSSLDRVFGYGLKYPDGFQHTHLGWIGKEARARRTENKT